MKVTVCFGAVRVVVPCGDGEILVKDLIKQAIHRYRKAIGKNGDWWVCVASLRSDGGGGGILDPDDRLSDVADDRERIVAVFEEGEGRGGPGGGDGASGSSVGTGSPDMFHGPESLRTDIEVTNEQIASGIPAALQVRRGSEPALNQLVPSLATGSSNGHVGLPAVSESSKRWSAAPIILEPREKLSPSRKDDRLSNGHHQGYHHGDRWRTHAGSYEQLEEDQLSPPTAPASHQRLHPAGGFSRDGTSRLSMQFLGDSPGGSRWAEAADRAVNNRVQSLSLPREHRRKEPLGQANSDTNTRKPSDSVEYVVLETGNGALGIHVVPDYDAAGKERGLLVQGIEPDGKVDRDGRLAVMDHIVEINGRNLLDQPFHVVQEIFRDSLRSSELRLRVVKHHQGVGAGQKKPPPPIYPKPPPPITMSPPAGNKENVSMVEGEERSVSAGSKVATVSPTRKVGSGVGVSLHAPGGGGACLQSGNTRRIGRKMELQLVKGPHGLGFSVTTRDNPAGGNCPIYIKSILPKGAAVEDGRLRPGDRLLAVDGVELTGKSQSEAVAVLRNVPPGGTVKIVVSRQEDASPRATDSPPHETSTNNVSSDTNNNNSHSGGPNHTAALSSVQPTQQQRDSETRAVTQTQKLTEAPSDDHCVFPWRQREILTFDIPVHDTEKAGLGVSVKGKTSASQNASPGTNCSTSVDLGIFVKSVLHGGAASRDGRLSTNDQLLNVNGVSLLGQGNATAMETLRRVLVRCEGPVGGAITLTVARTIGGHQRNGSASSVLTDSSANTETFGVRSDDGGYATTPDNSGASENSDNTVIFLPPFSKPAAHSHLNGIVMRNPVLERLTGQTPAGPAHPNPLRNESYYRATHQTTLLLRGDSKQGSPTVNQPSGDTVIIEEDPPYAPVSGRRGDVADGPTRQPRGSSSSTQTTTDVTYASQLSLEEAAGFSRDAFGRQSMSEKRHATLDAKSTDTYQRNKKLREERKDQHGHDDNGETVSKNQLGPSLGMKKSSSLESLQTMVQEIQMQEDNGGTYRNAQGAVRVIRGRGCNESFRAAVDRSYEAPLSLHHQLHLDTLTEDEGECNLGPRQSSLNTAMDCKLMKAASKKKPGLLKGIGSMFRFGKHRKSMEGGPSSLGGEVAMEEEREAARRVAREEQERIQEQYRRLLQRQTDMNQLQQQQQQQQLEEDSNGGSSLLGGEGTTRTERIHQLRAQHQRRHAERRGHYPLDEREERYEQAIRQRLDQSEFDPHSLNRPGSRVGISDPSRFSHYVNYQEIQHHINRRQQHYHSQRRDTREPPQHRPVSNFYEYESVESVLRTTQAGGLDTNTNTNSLPRRSDIALTHGGGYTNGHHPRYYYPPGGGPTYSNYINNNVQQQQRSGLPSSSNRKPHGPFVTHVTIRECQQPRPKV